MTQFSREFNSDFARPPASVTVDPGQFLDRADTPRPPDFSPLWRKIQFPLTPVLLLLWQDGTVKVADSYTNDTLHADDVILGGHPWHTAPDSWQAQVLQAAGYTLIPYEGPRLP